MEQIYSGRKHSVYSSVPIPKAFTDDSGKGYLYFVRIGEKGKKKTMYKIGTACNIMQRMLQHCAAWGEPIYILWVSPVYSKWTTLRVEDKQKASWRESENWLYVPKDRFSLPSDVTGVGITVKKTYEIAL